MLLSQGWRYSYTPKSVKWSTFALYFIYVVLYIDIGKHTCGYEFCITIKTINDQPKIEIKQFKFFSSDFWMNRYFTVSIALEIKKVI